MAMHLLALTGPDKGKVFVLNEGCAQTIGRSHNHTEITLQDTDVARVQCEVALDGDTLMVTDLDGTSTTFVNDQVVEQHTMKPGDTLRIGQSLLRFQKEQVGRPIPTVAPTVVVSPKSVPVASVRSIPERRGMTSEPPASTAPRRSTLETSVGAPTRIEEIDSASRLPLPRLPADRLNELAGATLGHFSLGPVLGEGHTGMVFKAKDLKSLRTVALRVLPSEFPKNDAERQRFVQAVKEMLHLDHVNLVKLYGAGKAEGYHWLATEFVEGPSLAQIMRQGRTAPTNGEEPIRAWEPAYRIAVHMARALDYAHQHQFIHRNITPTDILLAQQGDYTHKSSLNDYTTDAIAKLNDLVMFKALEGSGLRQVSLRGKVATELGYFSPEQTYGGAPVDVRSDMFSLGSVIYAVLMGKPPFEGQTQAETIRNIREQPPASPRKLHPLLPRLFDAILLKMLAKPPEHRFQSAKELLAALDQISPHKE